jgi:tetratricopeptide (TPR) repeat protein
MKLRAMCDTMRASLAAWWLLVPVLGVALACAQGPRVAVCDSLLARGDSLYRAFENDAALRVYAQATDSCPDAYEPLMKYTRALNDVGEDRSTREYFDSAMAFADTLQARFPDSLQGHFLMAAAAGNIIDLIGSSRGVRLAFVVRDNAERAIGIDSTYGPAHVLLGAYHSRVAGASSFLKRIAGLVLGRTPQGTYEQALDHLTRAVALDSTNVYAYLELAKTYKALDRPEDAREQLRAALAAPLLDHQYPQLKEQARELLRELGEA